MNKNNKKTMNERTHNGLDIYKENKNSNSNNTNQKNNLTEEISTEFNLKPQKNKK